MLAMYCKKKKKRKFNSLILNVKEKIHKKNRIILLLRFLPGYWDYLSHSQTYIRDQGNLLFFFFSSFSLYIYISNDGSYIQ